MFDFLEKPGFQILVKEKVFERYGLTVDRGHYSMSWPNKNPNEVTMTVCSKKQPLKGNGALVKLLQTDGFREGLRLHRCREVSPGLRRKYMVFYVSGSMTIQKEAESHA